jgi:hypothetical protein
MVCMRESTTEFGSGNDNDGEKVGGVVRLDDMNDPTRGRSGRSEDR